MSKTILHDMFEDTEIPIMTMGEYIDKGFRVNPGTMFLLTIKPNTPMENRTRLIIGSATPWHCTYNGKDSDKYGFNYGDEDAGWVNKRVLSMYVRDVYNLVDLAFDFEAMKAREQRMKKMKDL